MFPRMLPLPRFLRDALYPIHRLHPLAGAWNGVHDRRQRENIVRHITDIAV